MSRAGGRALEELRTKHALRDLDAKAREMFDARRDNRECVMLEPDEAAMARALIEYAWKRGDFVFGQVDALCRALGMMTYGEVQTAEQLRKERK